MAAEKFIKSKRWVAVRNPTTLDMHNSPSFVAGIINVDFDEAKEEIQDMPFCYSAPGDEIVIMEKIAPTNEEDKDLLTDNGFE